MKLLKLNLDNIESEHVCCAFSDKKSNNIPLTVYHLKSQKDGHKMPIPWIINSIFYKGELLTLEMKVDRYLDKFISDI